MAPLMQVVYTNQAQVRLLLEFRTRCSSDEHHHLGKHSRRQDDLDRFLHFAHTNPGVFAAPEPVKVHLDECWL